MLMLLQVAAFALTPAPQQYSDKQYMPAALLQPPTESQQEVAEVAGAVTPQGKQQQQVEMPTAINASWKCMLG
jgi:hypothetical protein